MISLLACTLSSCSSEIVNPPPQDLAPLPWRLRSDAADILRPGETARYEVTWHFLTMGEIVFQIEAGDQDTLRNSLLIRSTTTPSALAAALSSFGGIAESSVDTSTYAPITYEWASPKARQRKRRFNAFNPDAVRCVDWNPDDWEALILHENSVHDPISLLHLIRVVELDPGELCRVRVVEGTKVRLATLRFLGTVVLEEKRPKRSHSVHRYGLRMDKIKDNGLPTGDPEVDQIIDLSTDSTRVILKAEGQIRGQPIVIRLIERSVGESLP